MHARADRDRLDPAAAAPPTIMPIIAATREEQIVENLAAADITLEACQIEAIDEAGSRNSGSRETFSSRPASAS